MKNKVYIAVYNGECAIAETIDGAKQKLENECTHIPEFSDIAFYEAKLLKVKQKIEIVDEKDV